MAVRTKMNPHISYLRQHSNAALDDVFHGVTYWTDEQLQDVLDNLGEWKLIRLEQKNIAKTIWSLRAPKHIWVDPDSITVVDELEATVSTAHTYDEKSGRFTFTSALDTVDKYYYVNGIFISMWDAIAEVWLQKAGHRDDYINFKAGQNKMDMATEYDHCVKMHQQYRRKTIRSWRRT